jgi:hypothetical protein
MKTNKLTYKLLIGVALLSIMGLAACSAESAPVSEVPPAPVEPTEIITAVEVPVAEDVPQTDLIIVDEEGNTSIDTVALETTVSSMSAGDLTQTEAEGLIFMREEEKLARDVYLTLYDQWNTPIFQNIARSEQTHTDAIKTLLDTYGLVDPMVNDEIGVFINPDLQALYDQLVAQGSLSLSDAFKVGAAIEEIDILDLEKYIAQTDHADIQLVYENLMKGSRNHLRSFVSTLQRQTGETYLPQYLSQDVYDAIVGSDIEMGGNRNGNRNGGN